MFRGDNTYIGSVMENSILIHILSAVCCINKLTKLL